MHLYARICDPIYDLWQYEAYQRREESRGSGVRIFVMLHETVFLEGPVLAGETESDRVVCGGAEERARRRRKGRR